MMRKKGFLSVMLIMVTVVFCTVTERNATARVQGGVHDLSITGVGGFKSTNTEEVCVFCHTPHHAASNQSYSTDPNTVGAAASISAFLWNRAIPVRAWTPYTSPTGTLDVGPLGSPGTLSLLCLSCHDGIGAMNVLLNNPDTGVPDQPAGFNQFGDWSLLDPSVGKLNIGEAVCAGDACASGGGELQNDHPIGFSYDTAAGLDSGLHAFGAVNPAIQARLNLTSTHRVECPTCHDPHIDNPGGVAGNKFLVISNVGSALCLSCHIK